MAVLATAAAMEVAMEVREYAYWVCGKLAGVRRGGACVAEALRLTHGWPFVQATAATG